MSGCSLVHLIHKISLKRTVKSDSKKCGKNQKKKAKNKDIVL